MSITNNIVNLWKKSVRFGPYITISNIVLTYCNSFLPNFILDHISSTRTRKVQKVLRRIVSTQIPDNQLTESKRISNPPIWFCWMQGKEQMPEVVKLCHDSICKHSNGHPVIFLDKNNYKDYVTIPAHILQLYHDGKLKQAHFADIMRVNLLAQNGGLWLDATILVSKDLPDNIFDFPFFSIKTGQYGHFVSKCRWAVFCLGGYEKCPIFSQVSQMFSEYLSKTDVFVDYFMFDQFIDLLYQDNELVKKMIDTVPYNNGNTHSLMKLLTKEYDSAIFANINKDTYLFKLSWKKYSTAELETNPKNFYCHIKSLIYN